MILSWVWIEVLVLLLMNIKSIDINHFDDKLDKDIIGISFYMK